jgi:hypothetical protein
MRLVMLLIILVSFRHGTKSGSYAERQKGNKGSFHIYLNTVSARRLVVSD